MRRYYFLLVDDYSQLIWVAFLKEKSDAFQYLKTFKNLVESESDEKIKSLRTDKGGEFNSEEFGSYCKVNEIKRQLTTPYSPKQNGVVETKNRIIMSCVRSMLKQKKLPLELWAEAMNTCVCSKSILYQKFEEFNSIQEMEWEKTYCGSHTGFGLVVHVKTTKKVSKLEDRSNVMIFIGYELGTKAYRCFDLLSFKETISIDVIFEESQSWDFSQQGGQCTGFTFTSAIDLENSFQISTEHRTSNTTSNVPSYEQSDQGQLSEEEERPERYRLIQSIHEEIRGTEEEEIYLISGEEPSSCDSVV